MNKPIINITPNNGPIGTLITIVGIYFSPNSNITIEFNGNILSL